MLENEKRSIEYQFIHSIKQYSAFVKKYFCNCRFSQLANGCSEYAEINPDNKSITIFVTDDFYEINKDLAGTSDEDFTGYFTCSWYGIDGDTPTRTPAQIVRSAMHGNIPFKSENIKLDKSYNDRYEAFKTSYFNIMPITQLSTILISKSVFYGFYDKTTTKFSNSKYGNYRTEKSTKIAVKKYWKQNLLSTLKGETN